MKIVHLCLSAFYIDNYSYQENMLPKYHVKMGYDVTVIASLYSFDKKGKPCYMESASKYEDRNGYHVRRLAYKSPVKINRILRQYEGLMSSLEQEAPDLIFSHNVSYMDISVVADYLKKHPHVALYVDNHADYINSAKGFFSRNILHCIIWKYYAGRIASYVTKFYGVTPMRCRFLKEMYGLPAEKIEFLPMGVDDEAIPVNRAEVRTKIRRELFIGEQSRVIFTGGKIDYLKNTHVLVKAMQKMGNTDLHLIVCGVLTPEMDYLKRGFAEMPNIHYLGWCDASRVMDCMIASDMGCFPGTHSTLWEQAVGVGLPLVVKYWPEMTHVDVNGNCSFVKGDDAEELKTTIDEMLRNYESQAEKSQLAAQDFLYSRIARVAIGV